MSKVNYRNFHADDAQALTVLQHQSVEKCPDTGKFEAGFWLSPGFQEGKNIVIAETANFRIVGYAAISSAYYSNTLKARELGFGYPLGRLDLLEHFSKSELWRGGTTFTAFAGKEIITSVMALSNGLLDYVFVIPDWRGKEIAKILVTEALKFLHDQGYLQAWLEVFSHNQAAINLYHLFGFETFKEEISLGYLLN